MRAARSTAANCSALISYEAIRVPFYDMDAAPFCGMDAVPAFAITKGCPLSWRVSGLRAMYHAMKEPLNPRLRARERCLRMPKAADWWR